MSGAQTHAPSQSQPPSHSQSPSVGAAATNAVGRLSALASKVVRTVAFWLAVGFPLAYLPVLRGGVASGELLPFLAILAGNVLALTLGHDYGR